MDKLVNNFRVRAGYGGVVAVTVLAAGAVLFVSGQGRGRAARNDETNAAQASGPTLAPVAAKPPAFAAGTGNSTAGERRYLQACSACHGVGGLGQPHMGADLRDSRFIREQSDDALVAFVKKGRPFGDPKSVLGLSMPPLGGSPNLEEGQIRDIVAFLRTLQARAGAQAAEAQLN